MPRTVSIGCQDFETIRTERYFYVDKTHFIKEWWEGGDSVTLITRPRRFGKTLTLSMVEKFFSMEYAGKTALFEGLSLWKEEKYRKLQGTCPVISLSFAQVKETTCFNAKRKICQIITNLYNKFDFLLDSGKLNEKEKEFYQQVSVNMEDYIASESLNALSNYIMRYYGKKVIILLDEYDTPMQEAYVNGYWKELVAFIRSMFNAAFKTNPYLDRAIVTGITCVSRESIFSDLNNLEVVATTSEKYADSFGFTEKEVFAALEEYHLSGQKEKVKQWYDGFSFGKWTDIYNPWSILNFLDTKKAAPYWANSSSNSLAGKLVRQGNRDIKQKFEGLIQGETIYTEIDEQIVYNQLDADEDAIWSLLLASGYLKVNHVDTYASDYEEWAQIYELELTNFEVKVMFRDMIRRWFSSASSEYNDFIKALLSDDLKAMNTYMNRVALQTFSFFDTGKKPSGAEPERFYHGFVLGLMVELSDRYTLTSNRESGFGRYDIMLEPKKSGSSRNGMGRFRIPAENAIIIEFKVQDTEDEPDLSATVEAALEQIEKQKYEATLLAKDFPREKIKKYGFAFCGKQVLIGTKNL
ncbi:MAG: ATP-binding protein [Blautia sp.]|nr:ATP-binding protein [Blautia sp.]